MARRAIMGAAGTVVLIAATVSLDARTTTEADPEAAKAVAADAERVRIKLRAMRNYLAAKNTLSITAQETVDERLPSGQLVDGDRTVRLEVKRPNRLHMRVQSGTADTELFYDGKMIAVHGRRLNFYATKAAPDTLRGLAEHLAENLGMSLPLADFLSVEALDAMIDNAESGTYVGPAVINGIACDQIAFKRDDIEWQVWIQTGRYPVPRKLAITMRNGNDTTRYVAHMTRWRLDQPMNRARFVFKPPADAIKIDFATVAETTEQEVN